MGNDTVYKASLHNSQSTTTNLTVVSLEKIEALSKRCEMLIETSRADVADYELYLYCQNELSRRKARRNPRVFLSKFFPHFISSES